MLFDDILIYSSNKNDHKEHVKKVLMILRDKNLYANIKNVHLHKMRLTIYDTSYQGKE